MDYEVHQDRLVPSAEVGTLAAQEAPAAGTHEGEVEAEEGEYVEIQDWVSPLAGLWPCLFILFPPRPGCGFLLLQI